MLSFQAHGPDDEAIREGLRWVAQHAAETGATEIVITSHVLRQLGQIADVLGVDGRRLQRRPEARSVTVGGMTVHFRRVGDYYGNKPTLAVWVDDKDMERLDRDLAPLCAITWNRETDLRSWISAHHPHDLRGEAQANVTEEVHPVVAVAVQWLTERVNRSTGLSNSSDRAAAVEMLYRLRDEARLPLHPLGMAAIAQRHGLSPKGARQLRELAEKVNERRGVRKPSRPMWREDIVRQWRDAAERDAESGQE